jgi:hypothetical protein
MKKKTTAKAALCKHLLEGKILNIKNCFTLIGLTNCPREIGRMVERAFNVTVDRTEVVGTSRYGQHCKWVDYSFNKKIQNQDNLKKMKDYVKKNT